LGITVYSLPFLEPVRDHFQGNYTVKIHLEGGFGSKDIPRFFQSLPIQTETVDLYISDFGVFLKPETTRIQLEQFVSLVVSSKMKSATFRCTIYQQFQERAWHEAMQPHRESHELTVEGSGGSSKMIVKITKRMQ